MNLSEKKAYFTSIQARYKAAKSPAKSIILDEFCQVCGYNRKYAIRKLAKPIRKYRKQPGKKKSGRPSPYQSPGLFSALKKIWLATDQICSKKLKAAIPLWLNHYEASIELLSAEDRMKLLKISPATIDRLLKKIKTAELKGRCTTRPGKLLRNQIPIRTEAWDIKIPGFMEADTVAHCGNSLAGDFVWSLTMVDYASGWTECRATWNKGSHGVITQIKAIEQTLPFPLRGFDCDNGSEFLNYHLLKFLQENRKNIVEFTRSRPYKKNDNAHVEQKNWSHVRQLLGYDRIDNPAVVGLINDLYAHECSWMNNFFIPNQKIKSKTRINSKYKKTYHAPQTPYQRLMESEHIDQQTKEALKERYLSMNPFALRQQIERKLRLVFTRHRVTSVMSQRI